MTDSIKSLENLRSKTASLLIKIILLSSVVIIIIFFICKNLGVEGRMLIYLPILIGLGFGYLLGKLTGYFNIFYTYKALYKEAFVNAPFQNTFSNVVYNIDEGIEEEVIQASGIMDMGNRYSSNDYIQGYYKDVKFIRADVTIQQHYDNGKSSYTVTYLHGRWLIFEFNKNFNFDLQIISDNFQHPDKKNSIFDGSNERRHRIKLEDIEFNEMFDVFCQNDHEAYYILTPQFMSVLKDMYKTMDGSILLGFIDNELHVAIHNDNDAMEPSIFSRIDVESAEIEVQNEINVIINIIESLELDRVLYKK